MRGGLKGFPQARFESIYQTCDESASSHAFDVRKESSKAFLELDLSEFIRLVTKAPVVMISICRKRAQKVSPGAI